MSTYPCLVKFCRLFFEPIHHSIFHFFINGIMFASWTLFYGAEEMGYMLSYSYSEKMLDILRSRDVIKWYIFLYFFIIKGFRSIVFIFIVTSQRFGRYVFWPSPGVCRTRKPTSNYVLYWIHGSRLCWFR